MMIIWTNTHKNNNKLQEEHMQRKCLIQQKGVRWETVFVQKDIQQMKIGDFV